MNEERNLPYGIDLIQLDYNKPNAAAYSIRDDTLMIIDLSSSGIQCYSLDYKIECLSFFRGEYLAIGSKDQAIRVVEWRSLPTKIKKKGKEEEHEKKEKIEEEHDKKI